MCTDVDYHLNPDQFLVQGFQDTHVTANVRSGYTATWLPDFPQPWMEVSTNTRQVSTNMCMYMYNHSTTAIYKLLCN